MSDLDRLRERARPRTRTVEICLDGELANEWARLGVEYDNAEGDARAELAVRMDALRDRMEAEVEEFTFQQVGYQAWEDLVVDSPPTPEQQERGLDHDAREFQPKALAASLVKPSLDAGEVGELKKMLTVEQYQRLWDACLAVNARDNRIPFSVSDSGSPQTSEPKSTTPPSGGSHAASS